MLKDFKKYIKGKKVTIMGLGLLGRGIGVTKFLAECGAELIVTDLKTAEQLSSSIKQLTKYKNIKFVFGEHRLEDFNGRDLIIKAAGVPLDSPFIDEARKNSIPVEMDASLFAKFAMLAGVKIVGVTGTRGKTTVTMLLYKILEDALRLRSEQKNSRVFLGGNIRGLATLPLLKKVKTGDIVLMELDSWQLQGFGEAQISPNVSVFTNLLVDHQNYYKKSPSNPKTLEDGMELYFADKANIYRYQKEGDVIVAGKDIAKKIKLDLPKFRSAKPKQASKLIEVSAKNFPTGWKTKLLGEHNLFNAALAIEAARALGVKEIIIKKAIANFPGVPGRLEFIREVGGVKYYNDTTATTPDGVIAALEALKKYQGKIVLLGGGADKELAYDKYVKEVKKSIKALVLFKGAATEKILEELKIKNVKLKEEIKTKNFSVMAVDSMSDAFTWAKSQAKRGEVVILSPGAASFGVFKNEYDRGDQFVNLIKKLK